MIVGFALEWGSLRAISHYCQTLSRIVINIFHNFFSMSKKHSSFLDFNCLALLFWIDRRSGYYSVQTLHIVARDWIFWFYIMYHIRFFFKNIIALVRLYYSKYIWKHFDNESPPKKEKKQASIILFLREIGRKAPELDFLMSQINSITLQK